MLIDTADLIFDARSVTQLLYMYSAFEGRFSADSTTLLWKGSEEDLLKASKLIKLPEQIIILDIISKDSVLVRDFHAIKKIKNGLSRVSVRSKKSYLCTSFASGFYFEVIKSGLSIENNQVIQFDDGLSNELIEANDKRVLRSLLYVINGIFLFPPKYRLFSDHRFKNIYTSINPDHIVEDSSKVVVDISERVSSTFFRISKQHVNVISPKSALLMTTHSVESKRTDKNEFQSVIGGVVKRLRGLGAQEVYLSKHPAEGYGNDEFYKSIGLITCYEDFPSELLVANKHITLVANPFNSTLIMCDYLKLLDHIKTVVSYWPANAPYKSQRIKMIENLLDKYSICHYII